MNDIKKLGLKYGTDKVTKHNYDIVYHDLFKDKRETIKKVLEIGAGEGLGLRMFRDYFPNAMIYGGEIEKERCFKEDRIEVYECDQSKKKDLEKLLEKTGTDLDIIIDDGSHEPFDQMSTCINIISMLTSDFIYVIEDVADDDLIKRLGQEIVIGKKKFYADEIKLGERYDDRVIIIRPKITKRYDE